jgi:hypothetical protein
MTFATNRMDWTTRIHLVSANFHWARLAIGMSQRQAPWWRERNRPKSTLFTFPLSTTAIRLAEDTRYV